MLREIKDAVSVSAGIGVAQRCEIRCIDGIDYLRDERLFSGLAEFESELRVTPEIFCGFDLWTGTEGRRVEWAGVNRSKKCCCSERSISGCREQQAEMTKHTISEGGCDRTGISLQFV